MANSTISQKTYGITGGGLVLQVIQATKTDTASTTSTSFVSSGLSASITPSNTSNKVKITVMISSGGRGSADGHAFFDLRRSTSTSILQGDSDSSNRVECTAASDFSWNGDGVSSNIITYLDSPNTTSATTYYVYYASSDGTAIGINRSTNDSDATDNCRATSVMILEEIDGT